MSTAWAPNHPNTTPTGDSKRRLRAVVADDSGLMRRTITQILQAEQDIEVIATARDGAEAIELAERLQPDVTTMDVTMPRVDGLRAVQVIMGRHPVPIVIISSYTKRGGKAAAQAIDYGVIEIVEKPSQVGVSLDLDLQAEEIRSKVRAAARVRVVRTASFGMTQRSVPIGAKAASPAPHAPTRPARKQFPIVAIGASTGGPAALGEMLPLLPAGFGGCVLIVQHMPAGYTKDLAHCLDQRTTLQVVEAQHGATLVPGVAYIAPGGIHMEFVCGRVKLHDGPRRSMHRPSVDVLFESLCDVATRVHAVLLSGMGDDGTLGMKSLHAAGAVTMVQDEPSSVVWGMPGAAVRAGCATVQLPPAGLAGSLCAAVGIEGHPAQPPAAVARVRREAHAALVQ